jgi:hypothetical protein
MRARAACAREELVHVAVRPTHRGLQDGVQFAERPVRADNEPPPERWPGVFERDLELAEW